MELGGVDLEVSRADAARAKAEEITQEQGGDVKLLFTGAVQAEHRSVRCAMHCVAGGRGFSVSGAAGAGVAHPLP
jgi:hypothetical protein